MFWVVLSMSAQTYSYTATIQRAPVLPNHYADFPVCGWKTDFTVSYVKDATDSYFCLIDHSDFYSTHTGPIPVPGSLPAPACPVLYAKLFFPAGVGVFQVRDIFVVDDYAFFCGSLFDSNCNCSYPMWGYFDINDFFTTTLNIEVRTLLAQSLPAPDYLEKLVAYNRDGKYNVVAYGPKGTISKVVEITDAFMTATPYLCDVVDIKHIFTTRVLIYDIVLTDTYVVFLTKDGLDNIGYCKGHRGSVVTDLSTNLNCRANSVSEINGVLAGVALPNDQFGVAYVHCEIYPDTKTTRLRVFDLSTDANVSSYEFAIPEKLDPVKMVYLDSLERIELMQPIQDSMDFIKLNPYATSSYPTQVFIPDGRTYYNMCKMDGRRFLSTSGELYYLQDLMAALPHSTVSCPDDYEKIVEVIPNLVVSTNFTNKKKANKVESLPVMAPIIPDKLSPECFSFESKQ